MTDVDAKFKLEDILNKQKAPPQILDLVHIKIETEEGYKKYIQKIPDYKIRPERVSLFWRANNSSIDFRKVLKVFSRIGRNFQVLTIFNHIFL